MFTKGKKLSFREAARLCFNYGWRHIDELLNAVRIMDAESGRRTSATYTNTDGSRDRGLFQINDRWHPNVTDDCAYNALCNIKAARQIYKDWNHTWNAWSAYKNGSYKSSLRTRKAIKGIANYLAEREGLPKSMWFI